MNESKAIHAMTDREIAEETLENTREIVMLLRAGKQALEAAASNPMLRAMMPKIGA